MARSDGIKITRRAIEALPPEARSSRGTWHADRELAGFYVVAYQTGELAFAVRYRVHGQRKTVRLGRYPSTTPEDARKAALAVLGAAARGEDEAANRAKAREDAEGLHRRLTFKKWREEYVLEAGRRLKSTRDPERYLGIAGREWDSRALADISARDVETLRNRIAEKTPIQANRFLANVRSSFSHAVRLGHLNVNPATRVPLLKENAPRRRVLTDAEEKRLREVVAVLPDLAMRAAFTLLLNNGARLSEVLRARWEDFDFDRATWIIPSPKAGVPQGVPLLPETVAVVEKASEKSKGTFLLIGTNPDRPRADLKKPWNALKKAALLGDDVTIHDLRRTFGLRATRAIGIFGASKLLRHSDSRVTERVYAPLAPEDLRAFAMKAAQVTSLASRQKGKRR